MQIRPRSILIAIVVTSIPANLLWDLVYQNLINRSAGFPSLAIIWIVFAILFYVFIMKTLDEQYYQGKILEKAEYTKHLEQIRKNKQENEKIKLENELLTQERVNREKVEAEERAYWNSPEGRRVRAEMDLAEIRRRERQEIEESARRMAREEHQRQQEALKTLKDL